MGGKVIAKPLYKAEKRDYLKRIDHYKKCGRLPIRYRDSDGQKTLEAKWIEQLLKSPSTDTQLLHEWNLFVNLYESEFELFYSDAFESRWMEKFSELQAFRDNEGEEPSPKSDLGIWKARQQRYYESKTGMFEHEHFRKLWSS